ncbi:MAG: UDP-N-acetylmuramoyl-tripeptide--D-alanyl-D-alanine ligase [Flavobacteriaceae bacterium]|jgi:UDP-N-acetylmuramoyl-tripeptide--D-alanyl-D-alanine ligase
MKIDELYELFKQSSGVCTDTRNLEKNQLFFALKGPSFNGDDFALEAINKGALYAIVSKNCTENSERIIPVEDPLKALQKLARLHRDQFEIPVIGLTGSNGKTTTKELINAVLSSEYETLCTKGNLNNHIGVPLTLLKLQSTHEIAIIEMGANHQGEIAELCEIANPNLGLITNFGKAHLEGFGGIEGVIKGKSELYQHLIHLGGVIFFNEEDSIQKEKLATYDNRSSYGLVKEADTYLELLQTEPTITLKWKNLELSSSLFGKYNALNLSAAVAIAHFFELDPISVQQSLSNYRAKHMRSEIRTINGNQLFLDAYNANPSSLKVSLETFKSLKWQNTALVIGDMFELGAESEKEHKAIVDLIITLGFEEVYLVGKHFQKVNHPFKGFESTAELLENFPDMLKNKNIYLKASRSMTLEKVLDRL